MAREPKSKSMQPDSAAAPGVDFGQLEKILDFMTGHALEEFEYEQGGLRIRLKKALAGSSTPARITIGEGIAVPEKAAAAAPSREPAAPLHETPAAAPGDELHLVKSPIVGTYYASPSPEAPAFVKPGDVVHAGQVLCIIEAMKLMNEIEADVSGEIARSLVENGQPVEYGQPLFAIRAARKA